MDSLSYKFLFLVVLILLTATFVSNQIFGSVLIPAESREFQIVQGTSVKQISAELEQNNIIKSDFWFRGLIWIRGSQSKFLAGNFELPEQVSANQLISILTKAAKREVRTIKILEGWGIFDIAEYFESQGLFSQNEFLQLTGPPGAFNRHDLDFYSDLTANNRLLVYKLAGAPLEGYLFPDTYEIFANTTAKEIIAKMAANFSSKVTQDLFDEVARQDKNFYKVLIMASIIEAEVPHEEDRAIVSDIFWSRLEAGVPLQSDATLNYIIRGDSPALTLAQLEIDSAYNSYKYKGLPPTPIGNPGLSAIRAAIYPANTDYFYFLSTPEGETIFSTTLQEHNAAKERYWR